MSRKPSWLRSMKYEPLPLSDEELARRTARNEPERYWVNGRRISEDELKEGLVDGSLLKWLRATMPLSQCIEHNESQRDSTGAGLITICWLSIGGAVLAVLLLTGCATNQLAAVNSEVNASMRYQREQGDIWRADCPARGDCEDFALCKARKLLQAGFPGEGLALLVTESEGQPHAVLKAGDVVLDNRQKHPQPASAYRETYTCHLDGTASIGLARVPSDKCRKAMAELAR